MFVADGVLDDLTIWTDYDVIGDHEARDHRLTEAPACGYDEVLVAAADRIGGKDHERDVAPDQLLDDDGDRRVIGRNSPARR